ncbi:MAG: hypothetical protein ACJ761_11440, partial [Chloroflexota bacterium]
RLLVDGNNLLHALSRGGGSGPGGGSGAGGGSRHAPAPAGAIVGRLRGAIPGPIAIELVFDGPAERGLFGERIAAGVSVRYGGRRTADAVLLGLVDAAAHEGGSSAAESILVVSDDRALRHGLHALGARTAGTAWLLGRLEDRRTKLASPSAGNARPPAPTAQPAGSDDVDDNSTAWKPGRGATVKRGNPHRRPRHRTR